MKEKRFFFSFLNLSQIYLNSILVYRLIEYKRNQLLAEINTYNAKTTIMTTNKKASQWKCLP